MSRIRWYGPSLVLLLTVLVVLIAGPMAVKQIAFAQTEARVQLIQNQLTQNETLAQLSQAFRNVAKVVEPSVVHVEVLGRGRPGTGGGAPFDPQGPNPFEGTPFEDFFRGRPGPQQDMQAPDGNGGNFEQYNRAVPRGNGSGWVYDTRGHIITNNHVVDGAEEIKVRFQDGSEYRAQVVGKDPSTDVAVLKVEAGDLIPLTPSKEAVQPGDMVFAFGSPFGFDFSMSQGIVSAKGRKLHIISQGYENFIQTDAAINPGNSGGPLTNIYGQVVGVNSAIASRTGAYSGLGFAIPITIVTQVADQLIEKGAVSRGYLGIFISDLDAKMARTFGFEGQGVLVEGVTGDDSPAAAGGIESGDIITRINGEPVETADDLRFRVAGLAPGSDIEVELFRGGETMSRTITLGELPTNGMASAAPVGGRQQPEAPSSKGMETLQKWGVMDVVEFTPQLAEQMGVGYREGVLVRQVRRGSIAEGEGLAAVQRMPILIADVQGQPVADPRALASALESADARKGVRLRLAVWNGRADEWTSRFVLLELPNN